ncbi:MAG: hypothetical protein JNK63_08235 [Chthonomonas sp.]|nr:hypothetical protein [Chthonomonas sp.]
MRWIKLVSWIVLVVAVGVLIGSVPIEKSYESKASLVQRIQVDEAASLFGEAGTPIGSPQMLIIEDSGAFLEGKSKEGARLVSEGYLSDKKIYPLQLQTVHVVARYTRIGAGVAALLAAIVLALIKKGPKHEVYLH